MKKNQVLSNEPPPTNIKQASAAFLNVFTWKNKYGVAQGGCWKENPKFSPSFTYHMVGKVCSLDRGGRKLRETVPWMSFSNTYKYLVFSDSCIPKISSPYCTPSVGFVGSQEQLGWMGELEIQIKEVELGKQETIKELVSTSTKFMTWLEERQGGDSRSQQPISSPN